MDFGFNYLVIQVSDDNQHFAHVIITDQGQLILSNTFPSAPGVHPRTITGQVLVRDASENPDKVAAKVRAHLLNKSRMMDADNLRVVINGGMITHTESTALRAYKSDIPYQQKLIPHKMMWLTNELNRASDEIARSSQIVDGTTPKVALDRVNRRVASFLDATTFTGNRENFLGSNRIIVL